MKGEMRIRTHLLLWFNLYARSRLNRWQDMMAGWSMIGIHENPIGPKTRVSELQWRERG